MNEKGGAILVDFSEYEFQSDIKDELMNFNINYAFQPIYTSEGRLWAREALMRPVGCTPLELIEKYEKLDKLHVLEVATFFGAFQEYEKRGYKELITVNSFQSELLTAEESELFNKSFPESKDNGILELLEYFPSRPDTWKEKREVLLLHNIYVALDDYGQGRNDMEAIRKYQPRIVKLDRSLISDIDKLEEKQLEVNRLVDKLHYMKITVLAEGVETKEEKDYLVSIGVDLLQGYYMGRPE